MPIQIPPTKISRRRFLASTAATAAGIMTYRVSAAADYLGGNVDPDYYILLADTHVPAVDDFEHRDVYPAANLRETVERILDLKPRPAAVIINGDAAFSRGRPGEYALLSSIIHPVSEAGIPIHITMDNHDDRDPFFAVMSEMKEEDPFIAGRHLAILETPNSYLFLLDTLDQTSRVPGVFGDEQLKWLDDTLDAHQDKPVILFGHHHLETGAGHPGFPRPGRGAMDSDGLYEIIDRHDSVKAYFYGHTHRWGLDESDNFHFINHPATSYVFRANQPSAFVHARFESGGVRLELDCLDSDHQWHGEKAELAYR